MIAAAPAPPALVVLQDQITDYLLAHRFAFPKGRPVVMVGAGNTPLAGGPVPGMLPLAQAWQDGTTLVSPTLAQLPMGGQVVGVMLHETLHHTATGGADDSTRDETARMLTETATEAMTQDLVASVLRATGTSPLSGMAYSYVELVKAERVWSAEVCRCSWKSAAARGVRAQFFLTPPLQRAAAAPALVQRINAQLGISADPAAAVAHIA